MVSEKNAHLQWGSGLGNLSSTSTPSGKSLGKNPLTFVISEKNAPPLPHLQWWPGLKEPLQRLVHQRSHCDNAPYIGSQWEEYPPLQCGSGLRETLLKLLHQGSHWQMHLTFVVQWWSGLREPLQRSVHRGESLWKCPLHCWLVRKMPPLQWWSECIPTTR